MRRSLYRYSLHQRKQGLYIDARRGEQRFADGRAEFIRVHGKVAVLHIEHAAHKRKSVGMHAA